MNASVLTNFDGAKNIGTPFEIACNYCNTRPTARKKKTSSSTRTKKKVMLPTIHQRTQGDDSSANILQS